MVFLLFSVVCCLTLSVALLLGWLGYRISSRDLALKGVAREIGVLLCMGLLEATVLFVVYRLVGWTHWMHYLVAVTVGGIGYGLTHAGEMDEYQPYAIAVLQLGLFWPAYKLLALMPAFDCLARQHAIFG